jgi:hypothetical protein
MKSEDKAKELFYKVYDCPALTDDITFIQAQVIAIMMVEEIESSFTFPSNYWEEVKEHIMQL